MPVRLPILDLQTTPHRTYELHDVLSRVRVKIIIETWPSTTVAHYSAALAMTALIASVAGYPFDDVTCTKLDQPLGQHRSELRAQYQVSVRGQPDVTGKVTFIAEEDEALDGDEANWQRTELDTREVLQFGGALQLWLNLNHPV